MNAPSEDIKDILVAESSLDLTFTTNLFIGREPEDKINTVTIFDTPGSPPQSIFDKSEIYEYPSIQIRVKNAKYQAGFTLADSIKNFLHGKSHEEINNTEYELIEATGDPALIAWTDNTQPLFTVNFNIQRRPA